MKLNPKTTFIKITYAANPTQLTDRVERKMPYYTIHHDIKSLENLTKFTEVAITLSNNNWVKISTQLTIIYSDLSATQLTEHLCQHLTESDKVFLSESNLLNWASIGLSDEVNDWIYKA